MSINIVHRGANTNKLVLLINPTKLNDWMSTSLVIKKAIGDSTDLNHSDMFIAEDIYR